MEQSPVRIPFSVRMSPVGKAQRIKTIVQGIIDAEIHSRCTAPNCKHPRSNGTDRCGVHAPKRKCIVPECYNWAAGRKDTCNQHKTD